MSERSDALVLFGATGDLARKMIFPALLRLAQTDALPATVVGVAVSDWSTEDLVSYARTAIDEVDGEVDEAAFERLAKALHYVAGDYRDATTYDRLARALGSCQRPLLYLAIPPSLFETVIGGLADVGLNAHGRVVLEKPFGRDLASAQELNRHVPGAVPGGVRVPDRPLPRQGAGPRPAGVPLREPAARTGLEPPLRRQRADHPGRGLRRQRTRHVLRGGRCAPGRGAEPPPAGARAGRHGRPGGRQCMGAAQREGQGPLLDAAARPRAGRARAVRGLPRRGRRGPGLRGRDLRGAARRGRLLAMGGGPVPHPRRQAHGHHRHRGPGRVPATTATVLRGRRRRAPPPQPPAVPAQAGRARVGVGADQASRGSAAQPQRGPGVRLRRAHRRPAGGGLCPAPGRRARRRPAALRARRWRRAGLARRGPPAGGALTADPVRPGHVGPVRGRRAGSRGRDLAPPGLPSECPT